MTVKRTLLRATLLLHFAAISLVYGQIRSGTITGSVKDASGAIVAWQSEFWIPKATITEAPPMIAATASTTAVKPPKSRPESTPVREIPKHVRRLVPATDTGR